MYTRKHPLTLNANDGTYNDGTYIKNEIINEYKK